MTRDEAATPEPGHRTALPRPPWADPGPGGGGVPWAADPAAVRPGDRATQRRRRVVDGLPEWSPAPPGESLVRRPGTGEEA